MFNFRRNFRYRLVARVLRTAWLAAIKYEPVASKSFGSPALGEVWGAVRTYTLTIFRDFQISKIRARLPARTVETSLACASDYALE